MANIVSPFDRVSAFPDEGFLGTDYIESLFRIPFAAIPGGAGAGATGGLTVAGMFTDHPGIVCLTTGTTVIGRVFLLSAVGAFHVGVGNKTRIGTILRTQVNLSTGLQRYVLRGGSFSMALPNTILFGVGFEYQDNQNGGRWQAICGDAAGVETSVDTGVLVAALTWYRLEHVVEADGSSVEFFIDGVSVATIATNIPTGTGFNNFYSAHIMKIVGTAARTVYIDASYVQQDVTR